LTNCCRRCSSPSGRRAAVGSIDFAAWEEFYNVHRPHGELGGLTPCEVLKEKMTS